MYMQGRDSEMDLDEVGGPAIVVPASGVRIWTSPLGKAGASAVWLWQRVETCSTLHYMYV